MSTRAERKFNKLLDELPNLPIETKKRQPRKPYYQLTEEEREEFWKKRKLQHQKARTFLDGKEERRKQHEEHSLGDQLQGWYRGATIELDKYECKACNKHNKKFLVEDLSTSEPKLVTQAFGKMVTPRRVTTLTCRIKCLACRNITTVKRKKRVMLDMEERMRILNEKYGFPIEVRL